MTVEPSHDSNPDYVKPLPTVEHRLASPPATAGQLKRRALKACILASAQAREATVVRRTPLAHVARWVGNRLEPWAARKAFVDGVQHVNGVLMEIPLGQGWGMGGEFHLALGTYERAELDYVVRHLGPGDTFVDVGAHIGYFSLPAAKAVGPTGRVIALEPHPQSSRLLTRNAELNGFGQVTVLEVAASDHEGRAEFNMSATTPMWSSLLSTTYSSGDAAQVPLRTLDGVLSDEGWPRIAGLKIDVEGAEPEVIRGSAECLERNPRAFILSEMCGGDRLEASAETLHFLEARRFAFYRLRWRGEPAIESIRSIMVALKSDRLFNILARRPAAAG